VKVQATVGIAQAEESMGLFTVDELREVISVKVLAGQDSLSGKHRIRQISTDSRSVRRGDLFVALRGDRYDGHEFVPAVLAQGAVGAIVHDEYRLPPSAGAVRRIDGRPVPFLFGVRDPLFAYQQLATHHRGRFHIPVVAVTGSNGKTTTKDMVAAVGAALTQSGSMIAQGLSRFRPAAMRSQIVTHHGVHIINDCYNANPASMKAALQLLAQWSPARERIAVLGDMLELGPESGQLHRDVGQFLATQSLSRLIVCGTLGRDIADGARRGGMAGSQIEVVVDAAAAADHLKRMVRQGDVVLVKASRGMKMEQVVQVLVGMRAVIKRAS